MSNRSLPIIIDSNYSTVSSSAKDFLSRAYIYVHILRTMERAHGSFVAGTRIMQTRWFM